MAKVLEALIAKGRRVRRPREQKEVSSPSPFGPSPLSFISSPRFSTFRTTPPQVAFGLADLSTHEELHERIVKKGGCKSLIQLLMKSSDNEAQRFAALAIANIASAVFNRITMVQDDILQHLIPYITNEDSDFMGRQYCAMALGNLAAEPENHEDIVKLEGIAALISLLKSEEVEVRDGCMDSPNPNISPKCITTF